MEISCLRLSISCWTVRVLPFSSARYFFINSSSWLTRTLISSNSASFSFSNSAIDALASCGRTKGPGPDRSPKSLDGGFIDFGPKPNPIEGGFIKNGVDCWDGVHGSLLFQEGTPRSTGGNKGYWLLPSTPMIPLFLSP